MNLKIKLAEKRLQRASRNLDKWETRFYERQRDLQDLYKKTQDPHDDAEQIKADMAAISAWENGVVVKEDNGKH